jgi:hypothetical protein
MWNYIELILASSLIWLFLQTVVIILIHSFYLTVPWFVWGIIIVHLLIMFGARIPPPHIDAVNKVLGVNPITLIKDDEILKDEFTDNNQDYCMRVVAHRGAGYDYPENSISAFRYVSFIKFYLFIY